MRLAASFAVTLLAVTLTAAAAPAAKPAPLPAPKAKAGTVSGVVTGPDGKPLPNAVVRVAVVPKETGARFRPGPAPPKPSTAKTAADGTFKIEGLPEGSIAVRVEAPGLAPASADKVPSGASLTLKLKPGVPVVGRVLDLKTQRPVAGATVRALEKAGIPFGREAAHTGTTAEDGTFKIADCAPGLVQLEAIAPARARARIEDALARAPRAEETLDPAVHTLYLQPGGKLSGRVTGPDGKPLEGATVVAAAAEGNLFAMFREGGNGETTDASGRYAFEGLPAGVRYNVTARKAGLTDGDAGPIAIEPGSERQDLDIKLESGAVITFRLVTVEDVPVVETDVRVDPSRERRGRGRGGMRMGMGMGMGMVSPEQIVPGAEGKFTVKNLEPGTFDVTLSPVDGADIVKEGVSLKNGETVDLGTLRVKESKSISGRITDANGEPVAGASIGSFWMEGGKGRMREARSRADGRYKLAGLGDEPMGDVWVNAEGFAPFRADGLVPGDTAADFTLERAGIVSGRVLLPEGAAPVAFRVEAHAEAKAGDERSGMRVVVGNRGQEPKQVFSDPQGNFRLENVPPGIVTIEARADGYAPSRKSGVEVRADYVADAGTLTLSPGRTVRGRVVAAKDEIPVAGATVSLARSQGFGRIGNEDQEGLAVTGVDGAFSIGGLESRTYTVAATQPDFSPNNGRVEVPSDTDVDDFVIKLSKGGTLTGAVRDAQKQPVSGATVLVTKIPMAGAPQTVSTGPDGRYTVEKMAPGDYVVMRQNLGGPVMLMSGIKQATVREGETTVFDIDEASKINLTGRVLKSGQPVPNAMLFFSKGGGGAAVDMRTGSSDTAGRYQVGLDEPGTYRVGVSAGGTFARGMSAINVEVPDQPAPVVDITMRAAGIVGRVTGADGKPVANAMINARATGDTAPGSGGGRMGGSTTGDGTYAIENLPAGAYEVTVQASGYRSPEPSTVSIASDSDRPAVDFQLERGRSFRGQVVDPQGNGIAGAYVVAASAGSDGGGQRTSTDVNGTFVMTAPGDGAIDVTAIAQGFAAARLVGVTPSEDEALRIQTPRGGRVRVTALGANGAPVPGASVRCSAKPGFLGSDYAAMFSGSLSTGSDGAISVGPLAPGSYEIAVSSGAKRQTQSINVTEGGEAVVSVVLP